jgi:hypothetical protein
MKIPKPFSPVSSCRRLISLRQLNPPSPRNISNALTEYLINAQQLGLCKRARFTPALSKLGEEHHRCQPLRTSHFKDIYATDTWILSRALTAEPFPQFQCNSKPAHHVFGKALSIPKAPVDEQRQHEDSRSLRCRRYCKFPVSIGRSSHPKLELIPIVFTWFLLLRGCLDLLQVCQEWLGCPRQIRRLGTRHLLSTGNVGHQLDREDSIERRQLQLLGFWCCVEGPAGPLFGICSYGWRSGWLCGETGFH